MVRIYRFAEKREEPVSIPCFDDTLTPPLLPASPWRCPRFTKVAMTMNVNLTHQLEEMVRRKVASGLYASVSEVIREALRLMEEQDRMRAAKLEQLRGDPRWPRQRRADAVECRGNQAGKSREKSRASRR